MDHSPHRIVLLLGILFLLSLASSCSPRRVPAETAAPYHPHRIAAGVPARPGSASWSPDGKRIAFLTTTVNIFDREQGSLKTVGIRDPSYLLWTAEQELLVIAESPKSPMLFVVKTDTYAVTQHALGPGACAVYDLDVDRLIVLSAKQTVQKLWTEMQCQLSTYDRRSNTQKDLYSFDKVYPRWIPAELLLDWLYAGFDPLNNELLLLELVTPPVVSPYTRLTSIDVLTGVAPEIAAPEKTVYTAISWSPDGRKLALSEASGRLVISDQRAVPKTVQASVTGSSPAWNPRGSQIYFGGYVVLSNGKTETALLADSSRSIGFWSGDGTRLAVAANGDLWLFEGFTPAFLPTDSPLDDRLKNKLSLLKSLRIDGLITQQEYQDRHARLLERTEVFP